MKLIQSILGLFYFLFFTDNSDKIQKKSTHQLPLFLFSSVYFSFCREKSSPENQTIIDDFNRKIPTNTQTSIINVLKRLSLQSTKYKISSKNSFKSNFVQYSFTHWHSKRNLWRIYTISKCVSNTLDWLMKTSAVRFGVVCTLALSWLDCMR